MEKELQSKPGSVPITKVGHTFSGFQGSDPFAKAKGAAGVQPTEQTFGK